MSPNKGLATHPHWKILEDFELAWDHAPPCPRLREFLKGDLQPDRELLIELASIDLRKRWHKARLIEQNSSDEFPAKAIVEHYCSKFVELGPVSRAPLKLIRAEYLARHKWGDQPTHNQILSCYGDYGSELIQALHEIDAELRSDSLATPGLGSGDTPGQIQADRPFAPSEGQSLPAKIGRFLIEGKLGSGGFGVV